jgi:hypothetical protein
MAAHSKNNPRKELHFETLLDFSKFPKNKEGLNGLSQFYIMAAEIASKHHDQEFVANNIHDIAVMGHVVNDFTDGKQNIYRLGDKFGYHLDKTDLDVDFKYFDLEKEESFFFEFPISYPAPDGKSTHHCAAVSVGSVGENTRIVTGSTGEEYKNAAKGVSVIFPDYVNGKYTGISSYFCFPIPKEGTVGSVLEAVENKEIHPRMIQLVFKALLYLKSGDPDLKREIGNPSNSKQPYKIKNHLRKNCPFDVVSVGYGFHGKTYTAGNVEVSGHFRWQRYGTGLSCVKLIWIDEHIRNYGGNVSAYGAQVSANISQYPQEVGTSP